MKKQTFSVIFLVRKLKSTNSTSRPLYVRITVNGQRTEFSIQIRVNINDWNAKKCCLKSASKQAKAVNNQLEIIKSRITEAKFDMENHKEVITANSLRDRYLGVEQPTLTLLDVFDSHNANCKGLTNKGFAPATVERYFTTRKHFAEFLKEKYKKTDLNLIDLKPHIITDFEYYLKTTRKCCHNSATKYLKNFKKITRIALANGWIQADPFASIQFHLEPVSIEFLTEEELQQLIAVNLKNDRLQRVKDAFLFCCFTGLAYSDTKELLYSNIEEHENQKWIVIKRQKTKQVCRVPILKPALTIIEKYKTNAYCLKTGRALPVLSNQKMNAYLQEVIDIAGIDKRICTHSGRHTFASTVTLKNNVSISVVSKMLGHTSVKMTEKYAKVVESFTKNEMEKVKDVYADVEI